ncbi:MAG: hypothetical protein Q8Q41_00215 [bacterium]|nr:hypothetical protein [bacterium]
MNNQKGFANVVLIVLVVVLAGAVGYLTLIKKPTSSTVTEQPLSDTSPSSQQTNPPPTNNPPQQTPKAVDWESLFPSMRTALKQAFTGIQVEASRSISIYKKVDITGDSVPEVLVNLGTGGTANFVSLMRVENDKPVVPLFKQKNGKVSILIFTTGDSAGGGYRNTVEMLANKNAIYAAISSYAKYGKSAVSCHVAAYQWNSQTKTFDFSLILSDEIRLGFCQIAE